MAVELKNDGTPTPTHNTSLEGTLCRAGSGEMDCAEPGCIG